MPPLPRHELIVLCFLLHYLFASLSVYVTALLPLTMATKMPDLPMDKAAVALCMTLGIKGVISLYGTGPSPV
jgi:L-tartrate/succinate antiporter